MRIIYAIPGLGTTKELFRNISVPNFELRVLDWPLPEKSLTLEGYSKIFIEQIDQDKPVNLLGVSFGGMLCAEIAERLNVNKTFLVSSCKNRAEFPFLIKLLKALPLHKLMPDLFFRALLKTKRKFIGFEKSFEPVFIDMINKMPKDYFACCVNYIINWDRKENINESVHIHGTSDKLLTHRTIKNYYSVKGGSHAMILSNAADINFILNKELNGI